MIKHLDLKSTLNLKETSLIDKHLSLKYDNNVIHNSIDELVKVGEERVSNKLHEKYRKEFPTPKQIAVVGKVYRRHFY